jgi:elongation factor P
MNLDDYEQIMLQKEFIENVEFLKEGENVNVLFHADKGLPLSADLPAHVTLEITKTEPGVKGNTATNTFKPATTESGADIQVPLFINEGDKIKIDTVKGAYLERVKG